MAAEEGCVIACHTKEEFEDKFDKGKEIGKLRKIIKCGLRHPVLPPTTTPPLRRLRHPVHPATPSDDHASSASFMTSRAPAPLPDGCDHLLDPRVDPLFCKRDMHVLEHSVQPEDAAATLASFTDDRAISTVGFCKISKSSLKYQQMVCKSRQRTRWDVLLFPLGLKCAPCQS